MYTKTFKKKTLSSIFLHELFPHFFRDGLLEKGKKIIFRATKILIAKLKKKKKIYGHPSIQKNEYKKFTKKTFTKKIFHH
jgi:hypothetical protein